MIYRYLRIFNIDIATGACINALFFAKMLGVTLNWEIYFILFNSVWIIYTVDRLLDARAYPAMQTPRHKIHKRHTKVFLVLLIAPAAINLVLLSRIDLLLVISGSAVGGVVLIYLFLIWKKWRVPKEIFVAIIYSIGVALAPVLLAGDIQWTTVFLLVQHMLLAFYNLILIAAHEKKQDLNSGQTNMAESLGRHFTAATLVVRAMIIALGALYLIMGGNLVAQGILFTMMIGLSIIQINGKFFGRNERYGIWADAVFFIPALSFLL